MPVHAGEALGIAGGSLLDPWAALDPTVPTPDTHLDAVHRTAAVLDEACCRPGGATVLHDVLIPGSDLTVDHVVIFGDRLWLVTSRLWQPGLYWRAGNSAFRGPSRVSDTVPLLSAADTQRAFDAYLWAERLPVAFASPSMVVWPADRERSTVVTGLGHVGDWPVMGPRTFRSATRSLLRPSRRASKPGRTRTADPRLVVALSRLSYTPTPCELDLEAACIIGRETTAAR